MAVQELLCRHDNNPQTIFDFHIALKCPHCTVQSNISAVSIPRYEYLARFQPRKAGIVYRCDSCNSPIFMRVNVRYDLSNHQIWFDTNLEEVERAQESFDFTYLPDDVQADFKEALTCYTHSCYNAFAAMCRRCIQTTASELGAKGKDRVMIQLKDLHSMNAVDEETFEILKQLIVDGHGGAHPHLPTMTAERAGVMLELMKDVLYQLFVRKAKIEEAMELRKKAIWARA